MAVHGRLADDLTAADLFASLFDLLQHSVVVCCALDDDLLRFEGDVKRVNACEGRSASVWVTAVQSGKDPPSSFCSTLVIAPEQPPHDIATLNLYSWCCWGGGRSGDQSLQSHEQGVCNA